MQRWVGRATRVSPIECRWDSHRSAHPTVNRDRPADHVRPPPRNADQGVHPGLSRPADAGRDFRHSLHRGAGDRLRGDHGHPAHPHGGLRPGQHAGEPRAAGALLRSRLFRHRRPHRQRPADARTCSTAADVQIVLRVNHGFAGDLAAGRTAAAASHLRRHRLEHRRHRPELRQQDHQRLHPTAMLDERIEQDPRAAELPGASSISARGPGSTRTSKAATTSCPA